MKDIPDNSVDYVITSPQYNLGGGGLWGDRKPKKYTDNKDVISTDDYFNFLNKAIKEMLRITKKHIFLNVLITTGNKKAIIRLMFENIDKVKDILYWIKTNPPAQLQAGILSPGVEWLIVFSNETPENRRFHDVGKSGNWILNYIITPVGRGFKGHGAVFPINLPIWLIELFTKKGDIILDPFLGSGTTLLACRKTDRIGLGFEINPDYKEIIKERILENIPSLESFGVDK